MLGSQSKDEEPAICATEPTRDYLRCEARFPRPFVRASSRVKESIRNLVGHCGLTPDVCLPKISCWTSLWKE